MHQHFRSDSASLNNAALLSDISPHHRDTAGFRIGVVNGTNRICLNIGVSDILSHGMTVCRKEIRFNQILLVQLREYRLHAPRLIQIMHMRRACRRQVTKIRHLSAHLIENLHAESDSRLIGDRQQVENRIAGTAQSHVAGESVPQRFLVDDLAGSNILLHQIHNRHAGMLRQHDASAMHRGNRSVPRKRQPDCLTETIHAVRGVHAAAGPAARADILLELGQSCIVNDTGLACPNCFKHFR